MNHELTARELAEALTEWAPLQGAGYERISLSQVKIWYERRYRNGFPESTGKRYTGNGRPPLVWNFNEVLGWFLEWRPSKGGPPLGNQNARRKTNGNVPVVPRDNGHGTDGGTP